MIHLFKNIHFALKPLYVFRVIHIFLLDELDCPLEPRNFVDAPAHFAIRALAQLLFYFVRVSNGVKLLLDERYLGYFIKVSSRVHRRDARRITD